MSDIYNVRRNKSNTPKPIPLKKPNMDGKVLNPVVDLYMKKDLPYAQ